MKEKMRLKYYFYLLHLLLSSSLLLVWMEYYLSFKFLSFPWTLEADIILSRACFENMSMASKFQVTNNLSQNELPRRSRLFVTERNLVGCRLSFIVGHGPPLNVEKKKRSKNDLFPTFTAVANRKRHPE